MPSWFNEYKEKWHNAMNSFEVDTDTLKILGFTSIVAPLLMMGIGKLIDYGISKYKEKKGIK